MRDTEGAEVGSIYISSEQIIQEVQKYRCLYDPADPDHKDRDVVKDAWLSVSQAVVGEPWSTLNEAERNEAVNDLKKKWKFFRDTFVRSLKNEYSGKNRKETRGTGILARKTGGRADGKYIHYKAMSFLLETEHFKRFIHEWSSRAANPNMPGAVGTGGPDGYPASGSSTTTPPPRPGLRISQPLQNKSPLTKQNFASDSSPYSPFMVNPHASNRESDDPDRMFLLSLLPRVSALSSEDKMDFQIGLMQLLQGYEEEDSTS